jgi:hypothetical protein
VVAATVAAMVHPPRRAGGEERPMKAYDDSIKG